jgi:hypothetical protein
MLAPSHLLHITHPHVTAAYIKQDVAALNDGKQVLVLETELSVDSPASEDEDKYFDLLVDLNDIREQVEMQFGNISRVDIRSTCH